MAGGLVVGSRLDGGKRGKGLEGLGEELKVMMG
jgi:hypothetical protein